MSVFTDVKKEQISKEIKEELINKTDQELFDLFLEFEPESNSKYYKDEAGTYYYYQLKFRARDAFITAIVEHKLNKIISTEAPIFDQLPKIYDERRIIPNCFLRGALFGIVKKGCRRVVENEPIFSMSQYQIVFSGAELDQNDLALWDTLIFLAKKRQINNELRITLYELCKHMKVTDSMANRDAIIARANRLAFARVIITTTSKKAKQLFNSGLINNVYIDTAGDGKLVIEYNNKLPNLFTENQNDYTFIDADIRHELKNNQLSQWLYGFFASHTKPYKMDIDFIRKLCKSDSELKGFKQKLKISLEEVKKSYSLVNAKSKWNYEIIANSLVVFPKGNTSKQLDLLNQN